MSSSQQRPIVTELRLSAFKSHRGATFALEPITLVAGASGTGKSSVLEGLAVLGRLASGADLQEVFAVSRTGKSCVRGGAAACVPQGARPDAQGRRGFRIGCTAAGPLGPVRLDLAVQVEPTLRIVGERLTGSGETLLTTALRDPARPTVQAAWHTAGAVAVTRAPLPDDRLATSLLPLRVSGRTEGQRMVLAAAEQMVVALRGVFPIAPRPELMRGPVRLGDGRLRSACDNLSAVLARTEGECGIRHGMLVNAVREVCSGPVHGLTALPALMAGDEQEPLVEAVIAAVDRGSLGVVPVDRLGDGELRFLALALVLLTGPGVLDVDTSTEHLPAGQVLTVVADGLDLGVDRRQARELLRLAEVASARGHIRLVCTVQEPECAEGVAGVSVTVLGAGEGEDGKPGRAAGAVGADRGDGGAGATESEEGTGSPAGMAGTAGGGSTEAAGAQGGMDGAGVPGVPGGSEGGLAGGPAVDRGPEAAPGGTDGAGGLFPAAAEAGADAEDQDQDQDQGQDEDEAEDEVGPASTWAPYARPGPAGDAWLPPQDFLYAEDQFADHGYAAHGRTDQEFSDYADPASTDGDYDPPAFGGSAYGAPAYGSAYGNSGYGDLLYGDLPYGEMPYGDLPYGGPGHAGPPYTVPAQAGPSWVRRPRGGVDREEWEQWEVGADRRDQEDQPGRDDQQDREGREGGEGRERADERKRREDGTAHRPGGLRRPGLSDSEDEDGVDRSA